VVVARALRNRDSVCLFCWYNSANTGTEGAAGKVALTYIEYSVYFFNGGKGYTGFTTGIYTYMYYYYIDMFSTKVIILTQKALQGSNQLTCLTGIYTCWMDRYVLQSRIEHFSRPYGVFLSILLCYMATVGVHWDDCAQLG
jgi:hypothetical protein